MRASVTGRAAQAVLFAYTVAAAALSALVIASGHRVHVPRSLPWPLIAGVLFLANFVAVKFHTEGRHSVTVELMGVPVAVGAVFSTPTGLLAAMALAMGACWATNRTRWDNPTFNVVNQIVGVCLGYLAIATSLGGREPTHVRGVVAICVGVLCYQASTMIGAFALRVAGEGKPDRSYFVSLAIEVGMIFPFNAILAVITVVIAVQEVWGILLLVGPGIVLAFWYRASNAVRDRYADLQLLYSFTLELAGLTDTDEIVDTALTEARLLLSCRHAQLTVLADRDGTGIRCEVRADGSVSRQYVTPNALESRIITEQQPLLMPKRGEQTPTGRPVQDLMAVAVHLGELGVGALIVDERGERADPFDAEDLQLFEALAAHLSTALTGSQRLERLASEMEARESQALHDGLTGLANRILFARWVAEALDQRPVEEMVAVMLMDLDGFKDVNDTLGHQAGDTLLKEVASRLDMRSLDLSPGDPAHAFLAARLGGDEFAFVLPSVSSTEEAVVAARAILNSVSRPVELDGLVLELRASIGVAMAPQDGSDASSLLQRADVAMYAAKSTKRGVVTYDGEIDRNTKWRLALASELRKAMEATDLQVWYQPIVATATGELRGFEALLRWFPDFGPVSPAEFIPVAEQSGLLEPMTWWIMEVALRELKSWLALGVDPTMSVNLSTRCMQSPDIVRRLGSLIRDIGVPPDHLTVEITESLLMADPEWSALILGQLSEEGIKVAIDDFGTGYSSLSRLKRLPVDTVKIDRSFVMNMTNDEGDEAIVRAAIDMARAMGHKVIAEGVEATETWQRLRLLGCDLIQGFAVAPAMPSAHCRKWFLDSGDRPIVVGTSTAQDSSALGL